MLVFSGVNGFSSGGDPNYLLTGMIFYSKYLVCRPSLFPTKMGPILSVPREFRAVSFIIHSRNGKMS